MQIHAGKDLFEECVKLLANYHHKVLYAAHQSKNWEHKGIHSCPCEDKAREELKIIWPTITGIA